MFFPQSAQWLQYYFLPVVSCLLFTFLLGCQCPPRGPGSFLLCGWHPLQGERVLPMVLRVWLSHWGHGSVPTWLACQQLVSPPLVRWKARPGLWSGQARGCSRLYQRCPPGGAPGLLCASGSLKPAGESLPGPLTPLLVSALTVQWPLGCCDVCYPRFSCVFFTALEPEA